jgi:hypothetical protein
VVVDCPPAAEFDHVLEALGDKLVFAEGAK